MAVRATTAEGTYPIIGSGLRDCPLGDRIRKVSYQTPQGIDVLGFLRETRVMAGAATNEELVQIASSFFQTLGVTTANLESFYQHIPSVRDSFKKTYTLIAERLLKISGNDNLDFSLTGFRRAADFLRPLAYWEIPGDNGHVWGYAVSSGNMVISSDQPQRCRSRNEVMTASYVLGELKHDLQGSFARRDDPNRSCNVTNQCFQPRHKKLLHYSVGFTGPDSIDSGKEGTFYPVDRSWLEFGPNLPVRADGRWSIDRYTCEAEPTLREIDGGGVVVRAPVTGNCTVVLMREADFEIGPTRVARAKIDINNTERPEIRCGGSAPMEEVLADVRKAYQKIMLIRDKGDRIARFESDYLPALARALRKYAWDVSRYDGYYWEMREGILKEICGFFFETIEDPQRRMEVARSFLPRLEREIRQTDPGCLVMPLEDIKDAEDNALDLYAAAILTHPDKAKRLQLGQELLSEMQMKMNQPTGGSNDGRAGYRLEKILLQMLDFAGRLAASFGQTETGQKVLKENYLPVLRKLLEGGHEDLFYIETRESVEEGNMLVEQPAILISIVLDPKEGHNFIKRELSPLGEGEGKEGVKRIVDMIARWALP